MTKIKSLIGAFASFAIIAITVTTASAQVGRLEGIVTKADTKEPIVGAKATFHRTDIKGKYDTKSDKKGIFLHAGLPYSGTYTLVVSAPGFAPYYINNLKVGAPEPVKIELYPGDGKDLTLDDIKSMTGGAKAGAETAKPMSAAEQKKAQEEYQKAVAANESSKKSFEEMKKFFEDGNAQLGKNEYNAAAIAYKEALKLDPEQPVIWSNLSLALFNRGVIATNESRKTKDEVKKEQARADFKEAADAASKAATFISDAKLGDPAKSPALKKDKAEYLSRKGQAELILAKELNMSEFGELASKSYSEAAALSDAPDEKLKLELKSANSLFIGYKYDECIKAYQDILVKSPDNVEALYELGISYSAAGKYQESADALQQFINAAPETDPRVAPTKDVIKDLIVGNNLKPPKEEKRKATPKKRN